MNIFLPEYLVLFLILAAMGWKTLKVFRSGGRKEQSPAKGRPKHR